MTASPGPLKPFTRRELIESPWQPSERPAYGYGLSPVLICPCDTHLVRSSGGATGTYSADRDAT